MNISNKEKIKVFLKKLKSMPDFNSVKFVFLFGSVARNEDNKLSDIDLAVYYEGNKKERFNFRIKLLSQLSNDYDVKVFQDLPLFIKKSVLTGKLVYYKDIQFVYSVAYETIKQFNDFKKAYYDYIGLEAIQ